MGRVSPSLGSGWVGSGGDNSPEGKAKRLPDLWYNYITYRLQGRLSQVKRLVIAFLVIGILLLGACAPTRISEPPIPAHFTTYTDELGLFSISYPPDWELALSEIEGLTQAAEGYSKAIGSEGSLKGGSRAVFLAGVPYGTGYNPNVSVIILPSGEGNWKLEDLVEAAVQRGYMKDAEEYHEFSRTKTVVDGREAIILDCEAKYPVIGSGHLLIMYVRDNDNNLVWGVTCGVLSSKDFSDFETDFHAIVRSLRILKSSTTSQVGGGMLDAILGGRMLDTILTAAIVALPLAIICGLVAVIRGLIQRRKMR